MDVDFRKVIDPPLFKKFSMYNCGLITMERYRRDLGLIQELRPNSLRIDLSIGKSSGWQKEIIGGQPNNIQYHFDEIDELARLLASYNVLPYWSWCYTPLPLQEKPWLPDGWKAGPNDLAQWQEILRLASSHFRESGIPIGYHEVYNEPDLELFSTFTWDDYLEMFKHGVLGLRAGDPDAVVGGPAAAIVDVYRIQKFLNYVNNERLPLDFFSFHSYDADYLLKVRAVANLLDRHPRFRTTELHLNEFNIIKGRDARLGGLSGRYLMAAEIFDAIDKLLAETYLTEVHWAQFMDSGFGDDAYGLVFEQGMRKAAFNAFRIYALLPVERVKVNTEAGLRAMAARDDTSAGVVVWNPTTEERPCRVNLRNLPSSPGSVYLFRIDAEHASYGDGANEELQPVESFANVTGDEFHWSGNIPRGGVVYLRLCPAGDLPLPVTKPLEVGRVVRLHHYYPNRNQSAYAEFDRYTWTAYLGMGQEESACSLVGVQAEGLPDTLQVMTKFDPGADGLGKEAHLALRVDYQTEQGFSEAVIFSLAGETPVKTPWGTSARPYRTIKVVDGNQFTVRLAGLAPTEWNGRVIISFLLQDAGKGARARFTVRPSADGEHG